MQQCSNRGQRSCHITFRRRTSDHQMHGYDKKTYLSPDLTSRLSTKRDRLFLVVVRDAEGASPNWSSPKYPIDNKRFSNSWQASRAPCEKAPRESNIRIATAVVERVMSEKQRGAKIPNTSTFFRTEDFDLKQTKGQKLHSHHVTGV